MPFIRRVRRPWETVLLACGLLASAAALGAQTTSATVSGSVKDSLGAAVVGAQVTLTSRTQGHSILTTTDDSGRFVLPIVRPDSYALSVAKQGFRTVERTNVVVGPNDRFFTGVLTLEVGGMAESVMVRSRVSELQATSGERSFTLESQTIQNIANNGRSPFGFATLVPGILQQGPSGTPPEDAAGFTVNGQRPNSNNVTIDGVANIDTGDNGGNMATTNIDAVAELKILTSSYQAEYGRAVGGQVQIVTKSGTQSFHGSGYWYGRRSDWNANSWTNKRAAAPPPVGNGSLIEPPDASRNDFGYTIGGPIFIPGVFNEDKSKLFFFWSQEFQTQKGPGRRTAEPGAHTARAGRRFLGERRQQREPVALHPGLHDRPPVRAVEHQRLLPVPGCPGPNPPRPPVPAGSQRPRHLPDAEHHGVERHQLHEPVPEQHAPPRGAAAARLPVFGPLALRGPLHAEVGHSGAALWHVSVRPATTSTPWPGGSRLPGGTGWFRPSASSTPRRRSSSAWGAPTTRSTSPPATPC